MSNVQKCLYYKLEQVHTLPCNQIINSILHISLMLYHFIWTIFKVFFFCFTKVVQFFLYNPGKISLQVNLNHDIEQL
jgi:hypothetical protein